jgi:hypothetical protein
MSTQQHLASVNQADRDLYARERVLNSAIMPATTPSAERKWDGRSLERTCSDQYGPAVDDDRLPGAVSRLHRVQVGVGPRYGRILHASTTLKTHDRVATQVDREYLSYRSGGLNKIQMIDGGLLIFTRISSHAIVGVGTSLNTNCPPYSTNLTAFMPALLESAYWAPRARAPQTSEHAVRVGGRDVRREMRGQGMPSG